MQFFVSAKVRILFEGWDVTTVGGLVGSLFGVLIFAILFECFKSFNSYMMLRSKTITEESMPLLGQNGNSVSGVARHRSWGVHLNSTLRHVLKLTYGYLLMLICMTYNMWLFLAVVIGSGIGYLIFNPFAMEHVEREGSHKHSRHSAHSDLYGSKQLTL